MSDEKKQPKKTPPTKSTATKSTKKPDDKPMTGVHSDDEFYEKIDILFVKDNTPDVELVIKGQYKEAIDLLEDAEACQLTPMIIGPPGTGKTLLARSFAASRKRGFEWMTLDEAAKPAHFLGSFDPAETIRRGFVKRSFIPGPLTKMMVTGGIFLANELNRATEFTQNTFLEPLEERSILLPRLGRIKSDEQFFLICAANPGDMAGTHRISEALKDRIKVWIKLDYPARSVEMEIIHANIPHSKLSKDFLDLTHELVSATRGQREIERPASIRSAIAIAKLAGEKEKKSGKISIKEFKDISKMVLAGGIKARPGFDESKIINRIVDNLVK
ncbi:MAG: MoxR family ATPase [Candidatus Heimdallarchaeota archaeon]|nr:MoxR family ATPase [Candidatus Heimdallarchaeota archaeon]